jgi:hypothetical protein
MVVDEAGVTKGAAGKENQSIAANSIAEIHWQRQGNWRL